MGKKDDKCDLVMQISDNIICNIIVEYESLFGDKDSFVSLTEWMNGEGFDVTTHERGCSCMFQLTWDQWEVLKKAVKTLQKPRKPKVPS